MTKEVRHVPKNPRSHEPDTRIRGDNRLVLLFALTANANADPLASALTVNANGSEVLERVVVNKVKRFEITK